MDTELRAELDQMRRDLEQHESDIKWLISQIEGRP